MTVKCEASHYSGCGNDFLLFDNRQGQIPDLTKELITTLCAKKTGAGVDGLIVASPSKKGDVAMKFFNNDGSEADMCGNGVRCLMQFLRQKGAYPRTRCLLETKKRDLLVSSDGSDIIVHMGKVIELGWDIQLMHKKIAYKLHLLDSGVPHLVIFVNDVDAINVDEVGRHFRNHPQFAPDGANVNFVAVSETASTFRIRTYERGVEAETLACGTGVTAAAYALYKKKECQSPITFQVQSGEKLTVLFEPVHGAVDSLQLKGPATWIRDCKVTLNLKRNSCKVAFKDA